jgi:hypothetical protein
MGNNTCCEEEAKGGEFANTAKSHFQPNKISLEPNKFNSINFTEPPRTIGMTHEVHQVHNSPPSPPAKLPDNRWSKMNDDLPVIPEIEIVSKIDAKGEAKQSDGGEEKSHDFSLQQSSSHSSALRPVKPVE